MKHRLPLLLVAVFLIAPVFVQNSNALTVTESDSFTMQIDTSLTGSDGDYDEYTEHEWETRTYHVTSASDARVDWEMSRIYSFTSNEGGDFSEETQHTFAVDPRDGSYLDNTRDAPASYVEYYTYDNIWFQIDPNATEDSTIHILGYDYTVVGPTTVFLDLLNAVDVIEVSIDDAYKFVSDNEYDPDGFFHMWFDESYYFDPVSGYIVMYEWWAICQTSVGYFNWHEVGYVTSTSFELQQNQSATTSRIVSIFFYLFAFIAIIVGLSHLVKRSWKRQVDHALDIISGDVHPPKAAPGDVAPTLWNPLTLDYRRLLENTPESDMVSLASGVYIIIEPDNRIAVVDTKGKQHLNNLVFTSKEESIWLLYRLALGAIARDSAEYELCVGTFPDLQGYIEPVSELVAPDPHAEEVFHGLTSDKEGEYAEVSRLMARRKVLDYSLGQAPLSPESHLKKLRQVQKYGPSSVLLVGDDDLLSISLARGGVEVTLVEIDPYTCALIQRLAQQESLPITIYQTDLRAPLPMNLPGGFDLFVADPDFTIEAFGLFLSRGLSQIQQGGIGLINFQNSRSQRFKADYMLEKLNVDVRERVKETWTYTIVRNRVAYTTYSGKYSHTNYREEVALATAPYSSVMFAIRRTPDTWIVLPAEAGLHGPEYAIYDF